MEGLEQESALMRLFRRVGLESIAWSIRRLHCPIGPEALVLEVGAGGNPYPRANVLLDAYEDTQERHWEPLRRDRPFVFGFIENLPFKDGSFDFLIASHVLEHSPSPERALAEFQRVARAGYIEVPDALFERLIPYRDHRLEITVREGRLVIRKKLAWVADPDLRDLGGHGFDAIGGPLVHRHPFTFHVRYYWMNTIDFVVLNPDVDSGWAAVASERPAVDLSWRQRVRQAYLSLMNRAFSQRTRNARIDLTKLLRCPACGSERLSSSSNLISCEACRLEYPRVNGAPMMCAGGTTRG